MNDGNIDQWVSLLSEVEILRSAVSQVESASIINSEDDDFFAYEARLGIRFTEDYKAFCKTFGQGFFGNDWIFVYAPNRRKLEIQIADQEDAFYAFSDYLAGRSNSEFAAALDKSYLFGAYQDVIFVFCQGAGKDQDLNSHIYAIDEGGDISDFGQDFFGFIKNCCLDKGIEKKFPRLLDYMVPIDETIDQLVAPTFTPLGW